MNANRSKPGVSKKDRPKSSEAVMRRSRSSSYRSSAVVRKERSYSYRHSSNADKLKKKRDGTPDKPQTPGPDDEGNGDGKPSVLNNEEIQGLAIKSDELNKIRQDALEGSRPKKHIQTKPVAVKKTVKNPTPKKPTKTIMVARGAPPRTPLVPFDSSGKAGPRFDSHGNVVPHSILGSLEEYKVSATEKGELEVDYYVREQDRVQTPTLKYVKTRKVETQPVAESTSESNALVNWQTRMKERKQQQGYISNLLHKPLEELVMNQGDEYREKQELRYLIDRSIPAVDYGKGYRIGSEFWQQQTRIGDEETGIHVTLSQTQRGYPFPIEHVKPPNCVQKEKGFDTNRPPTSQSKPWHRNAFLQERVQQLKPVMSDLDPYYPDMSSLEVVGTANPYIRYIRAATPLQEKPEEESVEDEFGEENLDPLAGHVDVYPAPIFGPGLNFAGQLLQWTGDSHSFQGQVAVDARVSFEAFAGNRSTSLLNIINIGTTAMYFDWKMLPKSNPFDLVNANVQRFYFNTSSGVILPGDTLKFPFVFKSEKAGVFTEQWEFQTKPVVAGGASLVVTLRGVALREDKYKTHREQIEAKLQKNIVLKNVRKIVDDIVDSIQCPERPRSPIDCYITQEEIFKRQNPQLHYNHDIVGRLIDLHMMMMKPPTMNADEDGNIEPSEDNAAEAVVPKWNLNIADFKRDVIELDEEDPRKPAFLENINEATMQLAFPNMTPRLRKMYQTCYQRLAGLIDGIVSNGMYFRNLLGLPEKEMEDANEDSRSLTNSASSIGRSKNTSPNITITHKKLTNSATAGLVTPRSSDAAVKRKKARAKASDTRGKQSNKAQRGVKEDKKTGKVDPKKDAKTKEVQAKKDRASPVKKTPQAGSKPILPTASLTDGTITPGPDLERPSTATAINPIAEKKYKERLCAQVYTDINELVLNLVDAFISITDEYDRKV